MIFEHNQYRDIIKTKLASSETGGKGLSLRAFSKRIGVSSSFLSEVMNKKKSLSADLALKIAIRLELTETETQYFCLLVQLDNEKDPFFRDEISKRLNDLNPKLKSYDLSADLFTSISIWYHAAIMELTYLPGFHITPSSVAGRLGISKIDADLAIQRLLRLELIEKKSGRYRKTHEYVYAEAKIPNRAFREYHGQILAKAQDALNKQTSNERMSATDIVAIDSKHLAKVDKLSQEFSSAVLKLASRSKVKDSVYALSVHFFELTRNKNETT